MDWIRLVAASLISSLLAWFFAVQKSSQDADVKVAVLNTRVDVLNTRVEDLESDLRSYREEAAKAILSVSTDCKQAIEGIAADMKSATRELQTAVANIQSLSQTQAVVNNLNTKTLDALVGSVESVTKMVYELRVVVVEVQTHVTRTNGRSPTT